MFRVKSAGGVISPAEENRMPRLFELIRFNPHEVDRESISGLLHN